MLVQQEAAAKAMKPAALVLMIMSLISGHDLRGGTGQDENRRGDGDGIRRRGDNRRVSEEPENKGVRKEGGQPDLT